MAKYPDVQLFIDGQWTAGGSGETRDIVDPATQAVIGQVSRVDRGDLERAVSAAGRAFGTWQGTSPLERSGILRRAADLLRGRREEIARILTMDEGKPLAESRLEVNSAADLLDWFAEEGRRTYGRIIPARAPAISQQVLRRPVGPVAGFTPWNFPLSQVARKLGPALATGCTIIIKGPEDAPGAPAQLFAALQEAGLPDGVANLVFGVSSKISEFLVPHEEIAKISFTGSVTVGKHIASLAGTHMKRATMELGGHAPVIIADDAVASAAAKSLAASKFRNSGQVCNAPTRFLVQEGIYDKFMDAFITAARDLKIGNGLEDGVTMGPMFSQKQIGATETFVGDAVEKGAVIETGGERIGNQGFFYAPTILSNTNIGMRAMNEEPFGPVALVSRFKDMDDAVQEANRLPFGLASYAWTSSAETAHRLARSVRAGMLSINHQGLGIPETPYGGIRESGYGHEGGSEALEPYLLTQFVSHDTAVSR